MEVIPRKAEVNRINQTSNVKKRRIYGSNSGNIGNGMAAGLS